MRCLRPRCAWRGQKQPSRQYGGNRLSLLATYTYGKSLDLGSNTQEQFYPYKYQGWRDVSAFDLRHIFGQLPP
jgi:hypothetical protein